MRLLTLIAFSVTVAVLLLSKGSQSSIFPQAFPRYFTNLTIGYPGPYDRLLFQQIYRKTGNWWRERTKIVRYPEHSVGTIRNETITAIRVSNLATGTARNSTEAAILQGGVGYKNVTIGLYSKSTSVGINYKVEIWGRKY